MRRVNHLFAKIVDRDNLRLALSKALRGKRSKRDTREFVDDLEGRLSAMRSALLRADFPVGVYTQFTIFDPKRRLITAPCFTERVLHHAIMNVCEPVFERWLIADTFACRQGKGRLKAVERALQFSRRYPFFLKLDIRRYFESISHDVLESKLGRLFKDRPLLELFSRVVRAYQASPGRGLPIGALTSQHFANFYLGWFDRHVKERLRVDGYVRYMDDCILWGESAAGLKLVLEAVLVFLESELLLVPRGDPFINRTRHGVDFLGCRVFSDRVVLNRRSRVRFRRKLVALESAFQNGAVDELALQQRATALVSFTRTPRLLSWKFRRRVVEQLLVSGHRPPSG